MSPNTAADRLKKVMRIALIGIRPADQVILKGYLRILLRLEADLEWVSANHPQIDLFMINSEFQHAESVQRLLSGMPNSCTLFISRAEGDEGYLTGNVLSLPLKDLEHLNKWLHQNIEFLSPHQLSTKPSQAPSNTNLAPQRPQSVDDILASRAIQGGANASNTATPSPVQSPNQESPASSQPVKFSAEQTMLLSVTKVILQLYRREDSLFSLSDTKGTLLAYVQPKQQRIWSVLGNPTIDNGWVLTATTTAPSLDIANSQDLVQWLWQLSSANTLALQKLLHPEQRYQLTSWAKPAEGVRRHEQLKCQCVLESRQVTLQELCTSAQVSLDTAQQTVLGLLVAGLMRVDVYKNLPSIVKQVQVADLTENTVHTTTQSASLAPQTQTTIPSHATTSVSHEIAASQSNSEGADSGMRSFLSRLRHKLGI